MNQAQINEFRRRAKQAGKTDAEIDAFIQLKMNQMEARQLSSGEDAPFTFRNQTTEEKPKKEGFFKSAAKSIASPFARMGVTAYGAIKATKPLGEAIGHSITGNESKKQEALERAQSELNPEGRNLPFLGQVKPLQGFLDAGGVGAEIGSYGIGGGGAVGVGKGLLKGEIVRPVLKGITSGAVSGALSGSGSELQKENPTIGSVARSAATGGLVGGVSGGTLAAIPGIGIGTYKIGKEIKSFFSPKTTDALVKAIKPSANNTKFVPALKTVLPDIYETAELSGVKIKNLQALADVVSLTKKRVWKSYESLLKPNQTAEIDGNEIADAIMKGINRRFSTQNPGKVQKITQIADTYRRPLSLDEAEEFLQGANNDLHSYYAKNKVGQNAAAGDPEISYVLREAEALRKSLYGKLESLTGTDAAVLKNKWGALTNIENEVLRRVNVAARQNPDSLAEQLSFASGVGDILTNAGNMQFGNAAKGVGKIAFARYLKNKNTSDALVNTAFSKMRRSSALRSSRK